MNSILEEKICKICFENEKRSHLLINPCRCKGTGKWVHEKCLKSWLSQNSPSYTLKSCEICKYPYKITISNPSNCFSTKIKQNPRLSSAVFFLSLLFSGSMYFFCNLCSGNYKVLSSNNSLFIGILVLVTLFQIFMLFFIFDLIKRISNAILADYKISPFPSDTNSIALTTISDAR